MALPSDEQMRFLHRRRSGHLGTVSAEAVPHVVPVCYALSGDSAYIAIDRKPKQVPPKRLKRVRNVRENPKAVLLADHYDDNWERLGWVALHGHVDLLDAGDERDAAVELLRQRYAQYRDMDLLDALVMALRIERVNAWGDLEQ